MSKAWLLAVFSVYTLYGCSAPAEKTRTVLSESPIETPVKNDKRTDSGFVVQRGDLSSDIDSKVDSKSYKAAFELIQKLVDSGDAMYKFHGELQGLGSSSGTPKFYLFILEKDWPKFNEGMRNELGKIITKKKEDILTDPEMYMVTRPGAPLWDKVIANLPRSKPYVMLSPKKYGFRDFDYGKELPM